MKTTLGQFKKDIRKATAVYGSIRFNSYSDPTYIQLVKSDILLQFAGAPLSTVIDYRITADNRIFIN